ncbi:MAG: LutC/YkgG family protein [Bacteroidota bacterium]
MQDSTSKEKVLKNIRAALVNKMEPPFSTQDMDSDVLNALKDEDSPEIDFAMAFKDVQGQFVYCENDKELASNLLSLLEQKELKKVFCALDNVREFLIQQEDIIVVEDESQMPYCDVVITDCECLIARFGSLLMSSAQTLSRKGIAGPEVHIVLAKTNQIVKDIKDAFTFVKNKYDNDLPSMLSIVTGPSRTADIEKTLVMGAHGPKELFVLLTG